MIPDENILDALYDVVYAPNHVSPYANHVIINGRKVRKISKEIMANVFCFVTSCPNSLLTSKVSLHPSTHCTTLIKWPTKKGMLIVDMGEEEFFYSSEDVPSDNNISRGLAKSPNDVENFYNYLQHVI